MGPGCYLARVSGETAVRVAGVGVQGNVNLTRFEVNWRGHAFRDGPNAEY